eukprot:TRINITY_DN17477_c0_g1_i1.p1 TRINITY_DN17477_c0_g1~~TRINITY_DN17477_c0_g1_i1.p1  ORF type:complete len:732 (+),score=173.67 TRINITY_DN17477_c0_g1_i1:300-2495(+)
MLWDRVWIGTWKLASDEEWLSQQQVCRVLVAGTGSNVQVQAPIQLKVIPAEESNFAGYFMECADYLREGLTSGFPVLVVCQDGLRFSPCIVLAYCVAVLRVPLAEALDSIRVRITKPGWSLSPGLTAQLQSLERRFLVQEEEVRQERRAVLLVKELQATTEQLQNRVQQLEEEKSKANATIETLRSQQAEYFVVERERAAVQRRIAELETINAELGLRLQQVEANRLSQVAKHENDAAEFRTQLTRMRETAQRELNAAAAEFERAHHDRVEATAEVNRLRQILEQLEGDLQTERARSAAIEASDEALQQHCERLLAEQAAENAEKLAAARAEAANEIEAARAECDRLVQESLGASKEIEKQYAELAAKAQADAKQELVELQQELERMRSYFEAQQEKWAEKLMQVADQAPSPPASTDSTEAESGNEVVQLKEKHALEIAEMNAEFEARMTELRAQFKEQREEWERQLSLLRESGPVASLEDAPQQQPSEQSELAAIQLQDIQNELEDYKRRLESSVEAATRAEDECAQLRRELAQLETEAASARGESSDKQQTAASNREELHAILQAQRNENDALREQIACLLTQLQGGTVSAQSPKPPPKSALTDSPQRSTDGKEKKKKTTFAEHAEIIGESAGGNGWLDLSQIQQPPPAAVPPPPPQPTMQTYGPASADYWGRASPNPAGYWYQGMPVAGNSWGQPWSAPTMTGGVVSAPTITGSPLNSQMPPYGQLHR